MASPLANRRTSAGARAGGALHGSAGEGPGGPTIRGGTQAAGIPGTPAGRSAAQRRAGDRESSAAHTIERLIGVIPTLVWIVMGLLAVLSLGLAARSWLTGARARRLERNRQRMARDIGLLQAALLPEVPERVGAVGTSVAYRPAEGPAAGGDFYDVFERRDGRLAVIVGDVSGHGRAALPSTARIRYTLRAYLDTGMTPRMALRAGAVALEQELTDTWATVVLALYDPIERLLTFACAGHPPPLVLGTAQVEPVLECCSPPIGAPSATGLRETTIRIPGLARVCFFTDGVIEARVGAELFGTERLAHSVNELADTATACDLLEGIVARTDRRPDDMAACLLAVSGPALAPQLCGEELELPAGTRDWAGPERLLVAYGVEARAIVATLHESRAIVEQGHAAIVRLRLDVPVSEVDVTPADPLPELSRITPRTREGPALRMT